MSRILEPYISDEMRKQDYSKYYFWQAGPYDQKAFKAYLSGGELSPELATLPEQVNDLLNPGPLPAEYGWCILPSGVGYIANRIEMPNVTAEMFPWFINWFAFDELRYRIWWPLTHFSVQLTPEDRATLMDESIPIMSRMQKTKRRAWESLNGDPEEIEMRYLTPEEGGFDMSRFHEPNVSCFTFTIGRSTNKERPATSLLLHFFRPMEGGGLEMRTRFWMGYTLRDGKPAVALPEGVSLPKHVVKGTWLHCIQEFSRLRDLLPRIYAEYHDRPIDDLCFKD